MCPRQEALSRNVGKFYGDSWDVSFAYLVIKLVLFQEKFAQMIQEAGFERVEYENLVGGVVAIHSGLKL